MMSDGRTPSPGHPCAAPITVELRLLAARGGPAEWKRQAVSDAKSPGL